MSHHPATLPPTTPPTPGPRPAPFARLLGLALLVLLPGCSSTPKTASTTDYERLYQQREYTKAYQAASAAYSGATGLDKDRAGLVAGLASAALEPPKEADAQRWLTPLVQSPDPKISGTAAATLGMMAQRKSKHAEAVALLTPASEKLTGNDQARAAMFAGDSLQALGRSGEARAMYDKAAASATDRLLTQQVTARRATIASDTATAKGAFTIQVASFSDLPKAIAAAAKLQPKATAAGLPAPRVVNTQGKDGKTMHAVRIGRYATRAEAQAAQRKISGEQTMVMVATGE